MAFLAYKDRPDELINLDAFCRICKRQGKGESYHIIGVTPTLEAMILDNGTFQKIDIDYRHIKTQLKNGANYIEI